MIAANGHGIFEIGLTGTVLYQYHRYRLSLSKVFGSKIDVEAWAETVFPRAPASAGQAV